MAKKKTNRQVESKAGYHHGDLREQLVQAARQLVASDGGEHFKLADACRLAGVSTAAPYRHFANKEELLDAVMIDGFQALETLTRHSAGQSPAGTYDAIAGIGTGYIQFAQQQPSLFRLMFGRKHNEKSSPVMDAGHRAYNVLLEHVALFQQKESTDESVMQAAFPLWTFVHGLSFLLIDNNLKVADQAIDIPVLVRTMTERIMPS